jgi:hypothetical protein
LLASVSEELASKSASVVGAVSRESKTVSESVSEELASKLASVVGAVLREVATAALLLRRSTAVGVAASPLKSPVKAVPSEGTPLKLTSRTASAVGDASPPKSAFRESEGALLKLTVATAAPLESESQEAEAAPATTGERKRAASVLLAGEKKRVAFETASSNEMKEIEVAAEHTEAPLAPDEKTFLSFSCDDIFPEEFEDTAQECIKKVACTGPHIEWDTQTASTASLTGRLYARRMGSWARGDVCGDERHPKGTKGNKGR